MSTFTMQQQLLHTVSYFYCLEKVRGGNFSWRALAKLHTQGIVTASA